MGLLSRLGRAARQGGRFMDDGMGRGAIDTTLRHAGAGALIGGAGGAAMNLPQEGEGAGAYGERLLGGIASGAALGAGLGGGANLARGAGGFMRSMAQTAAPARLEAVKQEALQYVRNNPQAVQAVMGAQSADEIAQIVDSVIARSRSRMTEGGF